MEKFRAMFYKEEDGTKPLGVFIKSLRKELKAKVVADLHLLEEFGNLAREPLSKELEDGILNLELKKAVISYASCISSIKGEFFSAQMVL